MLKVRLSCFASIASLVLCVGSASAQSTTVLLSDTVGNGSFDVLLDDSNVTNTDPSPLNDFDPDGGTRAATTGANHTLTIPGWTFVSSSNSPFAGINFDVSTPAQDGLQSVVVNNSGFIFALSDPITVSINPGDRIEWSAFFGLNAPDTGGLGAYNVNLFFDGSTTAVNILSTQGITDLGYVEEGSNVDPTVAYVHSGPAASSVQIGFNLNVNGGAFQGGTLNGQIQADNFDFTLISGTDVLLGDVNLDGVVDFLDISAFISVLAGGMFQAEADIDLNGAVEFLDIQPFIDILAGVSP